VTLFRQALSAGKLGSSAIRDRQRALTVHAWSSPIQKPDWEAVAVAQSY
jgi:hypothetical protein